MTAKSEAMLKRAEELAEQAKQLRAEARKQKQKEKRDAKAREEARIQRDAVALVKFAKQVPLTVSGREISVYDFLIAKYELSKNSTTQKEKEGGAAGQQQSYERQGNESEENKNESEN